MSIAAEALEHIVTKSNKLIEASYRLSVAEQRVVAVLASKVAPTDGDFESYRFTSSELGELLGFTGKHLHGQLQEVTKSLLGRVVRIRDASKLTQVSWLSCAEYLDATTEAPGCVLLRFDPAMKPYLLQLKECFTSYRLKNVVRLRSTYSVRLYELLVQYAAKGERAFKLAELRELLAIGKGTYAAWKDFKRNVLDPAKKELTEHTDLAFKYEPKKGAHGRVVGVVFQFKLTTSSARALKRIPKKARNNASGLMAAAQECYAKCGGGCAATWENHKSNPSKSCYWCEKLEHKRLEAEGQARLPGLD